MNVNPIDINVSIEDNGVSLVMTYNHSTNNGKSICCKKFGNVFISRLDITLACLDYLHYSKLVQERHPIEWYKYNFIANAALSLSGYNDLFSEEVSTELLKSLASSICDCLKRYSLD